ncbi:hypothetical protein GCM10023115_07460 [Pontixanthobacter gangjinensis]|uniref:DUF2867 domain-containing protein n=1 Tax=Pontixanthobacter gangjinensis TaxID=1028742 RepID=A0A6I4SK32_9SPHN|nr:hypothetical protein [Pontixanthobacter gangjinensis]MXO55994.1 hypothetical protein [Pontixanthobacter gangjinensis]
MARNRPRISARPLPPHSLLAQHTKARATDYTDCFTIDLSGKITLPAFITAFYNSPAFRPERWALHLIGKGSGAQDVASLAAAQITDFAAWSVVARTESEILLQDFQHRTCSWLMVEPLATTAPTIMGRTRILFGSSVRNPGSPVFRALMPVHRWYAHRLLGSAAKALGRTS